MKKNGKVITGMFLSLMVFMSNILVVSADSGLDSNYKDSSIVGVLVEVFMNSASFLLKLIATKPGDEDYFACHITTSIICILVFYIFTCVYIFKLDRSKKSSKEVIKLLSIGLIPTVIFSLFCFFTSLQLILYMFILILYIIVFSIVIRRVVKNKIKKQLSEIKNIDKKFSEETFSNNAFDIYKDVQLAWSDFRLDDVKDIIGNKLFDKYVKKLNELKKNNQKNVMENIEYKSNKIVYINCSNNIEEIVCEMSVVCSDYIIENDKVVKGEKDKKYSYTYRLYFSNDLKNDKCILEDKKLLKTKVLKNK